MSQPLNNLDIIILIILGLSALIALSRGLIKEVLSIIGWVLVSAAVIYLLPVFTPITKEYIANGINRPAVTAIADKNVIRYLQHFFLKFAFILLPPLMMITLCYILLPPALLHISLPKTANQEVNNKKY